MSVTKAQIKATKKYQQKSYDAIHFRVPKGKREEIQNFAAENGETVNGMLLRLVEKEMKNKQKQ